jgi:hypothetical protein
VRRLARHSHKPQASEFEAQFVTFPEAAFP